MATASLEMVEFRNTVSASDGENGHDVRPTVPSCLDIGRKFQTTIKNVERKPVKNYMLSGARVHPIVFRTNHESRPGRAQPNGCPSQYANRSGTPATLRPCGT